MKNLGCSIALMSLVMMGVAQAAGPGAISKTTAGPVILVDAAGKTVGRVVEWNVVVATINAQQVPFVITPSMDANGNYNASRAVPGRFSSVMFNTTNCSGQAYLASAGSAINGAAQTAGVITPSGAYIYIGAEGPIASIQILSLFDGTGACAATNYMQSVVPATPINLNMLFTPPYTIR